MNGILNSLRGSLDELAKQIEGTIAGPLNSVGTLIERNVIQPIANAASGALGTLTSATSAIGGAIETGLASTLRSVSTGISSVVSSAENGFSSAIQGVTASLTSVEANLVRQFTGVVAGIESGFGAISSTIGGAVANVGSIVGGAITNLGGEISGVVSSVVTPLAKFVEQLPSDIATIAEKVVTGVESVGKAIENYATDALDYGAKVVKQVEASKVIPDILQFVESTAHNFPAALDAVFSKISGIDPAYLETGTIPRIALAQELMSVVMLYSEFLPNSQWYAGYALSAIQEEMLTGSYRNLRQAANAGTPNELLAVGQLVNAKYKAYISEDTYYNQMAMHGFSKENADIVYKEADTLLNLAELVSLFYRGKLHNKEALYAQAGQIRADQYQVDQALALYEKLLGVSDAITFWRRDIVPEGWTDAFDDLRKEGVTEERINAIKAASYHLPSIFQYQDFVARKVDDDAAVEKYALEYGIDDGYFANARANGFDEKTARRIYRSYWNVPPFFLLASEYKAGTISEQDMRDALAFQRFTPYWIDRFVKDLAPKLTQGDIKDMYKYQVISAGEIVPKLATIGITGDLAQELSSLWQASVKLASPLDQTGSQAAAGKIKDDTGTLVKTAYKDGILSKDEALAKLKAINYTDDAATLTLDIVDYEKTQEAIKATFTQVKDAYAARSITLNDALNALQTAGANPQQMLTYQAELDKAGSTKAKIPTLAEFGSWYKKGIISAAELAAGISLLGYGDVWLPFFMLADGVPAADIDNLGLPLTNVLSS